MADDGFQDGGIEDEFQAASNYDTDTHVKLFGKWAYDEVTKDNQIWQSESAQSLRDYIQTSNCQYLPYSGGRWQVKRFRKAGQPIVERLVCSLMYHGRNNGKKIKAVRFVRECFELIHLQTGENPIKVFVKAIINSGPREDSTRIGRGGVVRLQAVDVSPLRRVNIAIYNMVVGTRKSAFRNIKTFSECLADEIIGAAANEQQSSYAIKTKDEVERVAMSNR